MKAKSNVQLTEIPFGGKDGLRWNSLHSEREEICETIAKEKSITTPSSTNTQPSNDLNSTENWHRELLQARLKKLDEALDRVMSGSYGNCLTCGKGLSDVALKLDPAIAFCADCWADEQRQTAPFVTAYDGSPTEHGAGFGMRALFGSNVDRVLRQARCPVLVARPLMPVPHGELATSDYSVTTING